MKFAEFHVGQVIEAGPWLLTESEILTFANAYDPQWFHTDRAAAAQGPFAGLIASGWHSCAIAMRLVADKALSGSESFASPGIDYVKWPNPVRPGDALSVRVDVTGVRRSRTRDSLGILEWHWLMTNQKNEVVLELQATSLFRVQEA